MSCFVCDIYHGVKTFMAGMKVTATYLKDSNLNKKGTTTTIAYDGTEAAAREVKVAERFRGHLQVDLARCGGCKACARACPIDCIWLDCERDEKNKFRPSRFDIDQLKCMYCGLCVNACPTKCLTMSKEWWGSTFQSEDGSNFHGQLRHFGLGYYTPEQRAEVERKRLEAVEAKKKDAGTESKK